MNKKYLGLIGILVVIVAVVAAVLFTQQTNKSDTSATKKDDSKLSQVSLKFSDVIASYPPNPKDCLATSDTQKLKDDSGDGTNLMYSVIGSIIDIPAGTNVDVYVKTQDKIRATGTSIYESTYGSYNFVAHKVKAGVSSEQGNWAVTEFVPCKK